MIVTRAVPLLVVDGVLDPVLVPPDAAHRRFAVTINLDADYEGGCLHFPEFGEDLYRPQPGSAIVFSCGLLHEVTPVTAGCRHALLTFLW